MTNQIFLETRMFRLLDCEEIMTLSFFVLKQYRSVTDRQTDMPPLAIPAVCIARYANTLVKTIKLYNNYYVSIHCFYAVSGELGTAYLCYKNLKKKFTFA